MKKGFTLAEMLAVVLILGLILLIGVPIYQNVQRGTNESIYQSKIANVKSKAEGYSSEHGVFVFDIRKMIEWGLITPDNESGEYRDPVTGRDMKCDLVKVLIENDQYYANVAPAYDENNNQICYKDEEMTNMESIVQINFYADDKKEVKFPEGWIRASDVYIGYDFVSNIEANVTNVSWQASGELINDGNMVHVKDSFIKDEIVQLIIEFDYKEQHISQHISKNLKIDNENPFATVVEKPGAEMSSNLARVLWDFSDGEGSGVSGYLLLNQSSYNEKKCSNYTPDEIPGSNEKNAETYLDNGDYYMCVKDNVGNIGGDSDRPVLSIRNVDQSGGDIESFTVVSAIPKYNLKNVKITTKVKTANKNGYQMCLSTKGYMSGCSWKKYEEVIANYAIDGFDYGKTVLFYVSVKDQAGNISNKQATYKIDGLQYLDLNGKLNGTGGRSNITNIGTCDVYINGKKEKSGVSDYYVQHVPGTEYNIKNCKSLSGYKYKGNAEIKGTVGNGGKAVVEVPYVSLYTIKYNVNGGSGSVGNQVKEHGTNINLATTNSKRTGYTFKGWNTNAAGSGTNYAAGQSYSGNGNVTLYAKWEPNTITVTLNNQSATTAGSSKVYFKYNINKYYSDSNTKSQITKIVNPAKNGYIFEGYFTGTNGTGTKYISNVGVFSSDLYKRSSNITLYASWKPAACTSCTVTFNANGGQWDEKTGQCNNVYYRNSGTIVADSENFLIPYYRIINGSCNLLERHFANRVMKKNVYCNSYDVFYKRNSGTNSQCKINHPTTKTSAVKNGVIQSLPEEPYKIGFYFDGWYTAANGGTKIDKNTKVGQNTTYYAHWVDLANTFDINNYAQSKIVACRDDLFQRLIDTYTTKFRNAINNSQNFRNAMYDCGTVAAYAIKNSNNGYPIIRQSGRTTIVSGNGKHASCTCYPNKESRSAMKNCDKPACSNEYDQFVSGVIYSGRVFILSATAEQRPGDHGTSSSKCGDDDGYGNCENEGSNFEVDGYRAILMAPSNGEANEVIGWGYCNSRTNNAVLNTNECYDEKENRIAKFQNGLKVGLYSCLDKYYESNDGRNDRTYNDFESDRVYVQIFKI